MSVLLDGPADPERTTALVAGTELVSAAEAGEGLLLEMNDGFWDGTEAEVRRRAAQVVFTAAALEEGKEITLLEGLTPGRVVGRDGKAIEQPMTQADFRDFEPWVRVVQPVAGALVADPIPVRLQTADRVTVGFAAAEDDAPTIDLQRGKGFLPVPDEMERDALVQIVSDGAERLPVLVPIRLP